MGFCRGRGLVDPSGRSPAEVACAARRAVGMSRRTELSKRLVGRVDSPTQLSWHQGEQHDPHHPAWRDGLVDGSGSEDCLHACRALLVSGRHPAG